jgi:hypothetical protein
VEDYLGQPYTIDLGRRTFLGLCPIPKSGGGGMDVKNYRPIALMSCLAKLYSRVVDNRLRQWLAVNSPLSNYQFGFTPKKSTMDAVAVAHYIISQHIDDHVYAAFVDFSNAFPSVDHALLLQKLEARGLPDTILNTIAAMYDNINFRVRYKGVVSEAAPYNKGVKQGDPLSPVLFILFIDDLTTQLEATGTDKDDLLFMGKNFAGLLYADDLVLLALSQAKLQIMLDKLGAYADKNLLKVNEGKTKVMCFQKSARNLETLNLQYRGQQLEQVQEFKYLGVVLDYKLAYDVAIKRAFLNGKRIIGLLPQMYNFYNLLPAESLRTLFNAYVVSNLTYGAEIWGLKAINSSPDWNVRFIKTSIKIAQSTSTSLLSREFYIQSPTVMFATVAIRFALRMLLSNNCLIQEICKGMQLTATPIIEHNYSVPNDIPVVFYNGQRLYVTPITPLQDKYNFFKKAVSYLQDIGLGHLRNSPLDNKRKMVKVKEALVARDKARILEEVRAGHVGLDSYLLDSDFDKYVEYSANFSDSRNARTLLEVRANSMFKPAQFTAMGLECPVCHNKFTTVGDLTFHFVLSCHKSPSIISTRDQLVQQILKPQGEELVSFLEQCRDLKSRYWALYSVKFPPKTAAEKAIKKAKKAAEKATKAAAKKAIQEAKKAAPKKGRHKPVK